MKKVEVRNTKIVEKDEEKEKETKKKQLIR